MPCLFSTFSTSRPVLFQVAVRVLEEMVVQQRSHVSSALQRMPPLPSVPALQAVNTALQAEQSATGPDQQLKVLVNSLQHMSLNVRWVPRHWGLVVTTVLQVNTFCCMP